MYMYVHTFGCHKYRILFQLMKVDNIYTRIIIKPTGTRIEVDSIEINSSYVAKKRRTRQSHTTHLFILFIILIIPYSRKYLLGSNFYQVRNPQKLNPQK